MSLAGFKPSPVGRSNGKHSSLGCPVSRCGRVIQIFRREHNVRRMRSDSGPTQDHSVILPYCVLLPSFPLIVLQHTLCGLHYRQ